MRVEAIGLRKSFGRVRALDAVDLDLPRGARAALIGPNGSGKSTLTRALLGLLACEGEVRLDGVSPWRGRVAVARRLAYVPQVAPSFSARVGELVVAACRVRGLEREAVARRARRLGLDLGELASRPYRALSGGMKQKLLLALALAAEPDLLLLDEPTASLDAETREHLFSLVEEEAPGATLLLSSHRLDEIRRLVDQVVLLEEGRIAWQGPVGSFLAERSISVVEVRLREPGDTSQDPSAGGGDAEWLRSRGFRNGVGGWWVREARPEEAARLAEDFGRGIPGRVLDLVVRPLEHVEIGRSASPARRGESNAEVG